MTSKLILLRFVSFLIWSNHYQACVLHFFNEHEFWWEAFDSFVYSPLTVSFELNSFINHLFWALYIANLFFLTWYTVRDNIEIGKVHLNMWPASSTRLCRKVLSLYVKLTKNTSFPVIFEAKRTNFLLICGWFIDHQIFKNVNTSFN